ncbi:MAG TPA: hypothetical protein VFE14_18190 [Micromonosporaceae bacterium]|jgi:hypothetical protein|nr:hypothetical protein [Micromonosporaceae bacterium]
MTDTKNLTEADPALVAAQSRAAEMLLGATDAGAGAGSGRAGAAASTAAPTGGLPLIPASSSIPPNSRYAEVGTAARTAPDGREIVYLRRRFLPPPERLATAGWDTVRDGDRVDLVASRALGDPTAFWRLCDANLAFDPAELETPGRVVRVALPDGFPGMAGPEVLGA